MGLVHTPRTIAVLARGFLKKRRASSPEATALAGLGPDNPHIYYSRAGLFDVDYIGHMNNAAYLTHAELARWELTVYNGLLQALIQNGVNFYVAGTTVRYRKEVRPLFRKFQVESFVAGLDERNIWILQNFRYPQTDTKQRERIRAQVLVQGVAVQGRNVLDPCDFFKEMVGFDSKTVDQLTIPNVSDASLEDLLERYEALEESLRKYAAHDDQKSNPPGK